MNLTKGHTQLIIDTCLKHGLLRNQAAYVLATAWHETAHTMKPVREYGGETYLRKKKYYPYVGMGFVQLTWLENYQKATKELGVDFVSDPKKLLQPVYSAEILVIGSKEGWFAGDKKGRHKLSRYITLTKSDYVNARRIINGTDKASLIAGYAKEYEADLKRIGYGETAAVVPTQPKPIPNPTLPDIAVDAGATKDTDVVLVEGPKKDETQVVIVTTPKPDSTTPVAPPSKTGLMAIFAILGTIIAAAIKYFGG